MGRVRKKTADSQKEGLNDIKMNLLSLRGSATVRIDLVIFLIFHLL